MISIILIVIHIPFATVIRRLHHNITRIIIPPPGRTRPSPPGRPGHATAMLAIVIVEVPIVVVILIWNEFDVSPMPSQEASIGFRVGSG
jgi:hypothetical protein